MNLGENKMYIQHLYSILVLRERERNITACVHVNHATKSQVLRSFLLHCPKEVSRHGRMFCSVKILK